MQSSNVQEANCESGVTEVQLAWMTLAVVVIRSSYWILESPICDMSDNDAASSYASRFDWRATDVS
jgi:hypothetical protein